MMNRNISTILIIDDPDNNEQALLVSLQRLGYLVVAADSPEEGLNMMAEISPDLIFLGLDSREYHWPRLLTEIGVAPFHPPVIVFAEDPSPDDIRQSFQMGVFDCLLLPISMTENLQDTVERARAETERRRQSKNGLPERKTAAWADSNETMARLETEIKDLREALVIEQNKRIRAENTTRQYRKTFHIMFENTHDAIIQMDREGVVENANETVFDIFGLTSWELLGKNLGEYAFLGPDYMQALELYRAARPDLTFPIFSMEAFHKNGNRIYIETQAKPILEKGEITGIINLIRDITPQKRLEKAKNATILGLAKLAEFRDDNTGRHLERIREFVKIITVSLSCLPRYADYITPDYINDIYHSSILHDIGKVGIPDAVLLKPGRLTAEEFDIIKQHTILGGNALSAVDAELQEQSFLTLGKEIAYYHHESWDGSGYPEGLQGEKIPLSARIVALADVYDALTSERIYKKAYPHEKAAAMIVSERGKKFDPQIIDAFQANLNQFDSIRRKNRENIVSPDTFATEQGYCINVNN